MNTAKKRLDTGRQVIVDRILAAVPRPRLMPESQRIEALEQRVKDLEAVQDAMLDIWRALSNEVRLELTAECHQKSGEPTIY